MTKSKSAGSSTVQKQKKKEMKEKKIVTTLAPVAKAYKLRSMEPMVSSTSRSCRVRHRELVLGSFLSSVNFAIGAKLPLNPGLSGTFPWLSSIAKNWEQYKVHRLNAIYIPILPTSTQGDIGLIPDYDAGDTSPTSEVEAANTEDAVTNSCWDKTECNLDPKAMMAGCTRKFVRTTNTAGDIKTYDVGNFYIYTVNFSSSLLNVGKLFLDYDIEFFVPQSSPGDEVASSRTSLFVKANDQVCPTLVITQLAFVGSGADPLGIGGAGTGQFFPPPGCYLVRAYCSFRDTVNEQFTTSIEITKNQTPLPNPIQGQFGPQQAGNTNAWQQVQAEGIISVAKGDTVEVTAFLTGAAGVLTARGNWCRVVWSMA